MPAPVVYDINVLVDAAPVHGGDPLSWPSLPPRTENSPADAIGAINDRRDFALWLSPHILRNTRRVLTEVKGYDPAEVSRYVDVLIEIANGSGGGIVNPPRTVHVNEDYEDNLILDLAAEVGAVMVVSNDKDLVDMPLWQGTPVLRPREFAARADAAWRRRPRSGEPSTTDLIRRRLEKDAAEQRNEHDADALLADDTPDAYAKLRAEFDANRARLAEIVDRWSQTPGQAQARADRWTKNLEVIGRQADELDTIASTSPQIAHNALTTLNAKLDGALDQLQSPRGARATPRRPRPARMLPVDPGHTEPSRDDEQYGS